MIPPNNRVQMSKGLAQNVYIAPEHSLNQVHATFKYGAGEKSMYIESTMRNNVLSQSNSGKANFS